MTTRGWTLLAASAAVLGLGLLLGYRSFVVLGCAGTALVAVSGVAVRIRPTLDVTRALRSSRVERGTQTAGAARITNVGRLRTGQLTADDHIGGRVVPFAIPSLRVAEVSTEMFFIPTERRGRLPLGPLVLRNADPFGLAVRAVDLGEVAEVVVTPRVLVTPDVRNSLLRSVDGPESQSNIEGTLAFHTLREYVPGDDLRHVHWKSSARGAGLLVKQHVDTARPAVAVICDRALSATSDCVERLDVVLDCAASISASALSRTQPVWLHTGDGRGRWYRPTGGGSDSIGHLVDELTMLEAATDAGDARSLALAAACQAAAGAGPGSLAVVATSNPADRLPPQIAALSQSFAVTIVVHTDSSQRLRQHGRVWYLGVERVDDLPTRMRETQLFA